MTLELVISGGQTGVDQAALRAAHTLGLQTGGWAPAGWMTERGPAPDLGAIFGLRESASADYAIRTRLNVKAANATLIIARNPRSAGTRATSMAAAEFSKPCLVVNAGAAGGLQARDPTAIAKWLVWVNAKILNVAGNRESVAPGIGEEAEKFLQRLFGMVSL